MACAYDGTWATPRTYDEISNAVKTLDTTQEWFDFYLEEARRLKAGEHLPTLGIAHHQERQKSRFEHLGNFAAKAVAAQRDHLGNGTTRFVARASTAKAGAIPGLKAVVQPMAVSYFGAKAIKCFGMADREDVNQYYREALSKAGLVTNLSEFLEQLNEQIESEHRKEFIKEIWKDDNMQERLMEEMSNHLGEEMARTVAEDVVHLAPIVGHGVSAFRGWHSSGKAMDKALEYLSNAALEFHKRAFIPVVVARTLYVAFTTRTRSSLLFSLAPVGKYWLWRRRARPGPIGSARQQPAFWRLYPSEPSAQLPLGSSMGQV